MAVSPRLSPAKRPLCIAAVKSKMTSNERVEEALRRLLRIIDEASVPSRSLGIYDDPEDLASSVAKARCMGLLLLVGSGGTEQVIVRALSEIRVHSLLVGIDAYNSLTALLEAYAALRSQGRTWVHAVHLDLGRLRESRSLLVQALRPLHAVIDIKFSRIGLVGEPGEWLVYSNVSPSDVKMLFGSEVVKVSVGRILDEMENLEVTHQELTGLSSVAAERIPREKLEAALLVYKALRRIAEGYGLSGISVNCFGTARQLGVSPCYAVSRLLSEGVDADCEGSLSGLLAVMIMRRLASSPAMLANITALRGNELVLSHCNAPLSIASNYLLEVPLEPQLGVSVAARLPQGRQVTLARLDLRRGQIVAFTGRIRESGLLSTKQCRTQVVVRAPSSLEWLLDDSSGGHLSLVLGNVLGDLKTVASLLGLSFYSPAPPPH